MWTDRQQQTFEAVKACLISAPILGFPTEDGRFVLDTDASLFAVRGILSQLQGDNEVVIAYASRSLRLLYDSPGDAGRSGDVHAFPVVSAGGSVYPPYRP